MKQTEFDALVARLEQTARTDPQGYRRRVFLLAILGYAYIALVVTLVLALLAGVIALFIATRTAAVLLAKLGLPLATLVWITARAMWVRLEPPAGRPITRSQAPRLFEDAERIARTLKAPIPNVVLVTSELNASVSQVPRLGIFGWPRNYLVIGLQLASALHPDYFLAVLAHEFAHLSRAHGHFAGWVYRLRRTWAQLVDALERDRHVGTVIFSKFFNWYAPYFAAYSFVLAREYEYEADRLAASIVGPRDMAGALIVLAVKHRELEGQYWPDLWSTAVSAADAPANAISRSLGCAAARPDPERYGFWAYASFQEHTDTLDTHPALKERVGALLAAEPVVPDEEPWIRSLRIAFDRPTPPEDPPVRAAPLYFGPLIHELAAGMDVEWRNAAAEPWRQRFAYCQASQKELEELDQRAAAGTITVDEAWKRSHLTEEFCTAELAEPLYRAVLERAPNHTGARFALGRILLQRGEADGIGEIERAMNADANLLLPGAQLVTNFLTVSGRASDAPGYRAKVIDRFNEMMEAQQERNFLGPKTAFAEATLDGDTVAGIVAQLADHPDITRAWLVRQAVKKMTDMPAHVLALNIDGSKLSDKAQEVRGNTIVDKLTLPPGVNAFVLVKEHAALQKRITAVSGSAVYARGKLVGAGGSGTRTR